MKMTALILAILLAAFGLSLAETLPEEAQEEPIVTLMGTVNQMTEEGLLLDTEMGLVLARPNEETLLEGFDALENLEAGRVVEVMYNGMMTRSIPAQINAMKITSVQMTGTVTEVLEDAFLMETVTHGPVMVNATKDMALPKAGDEVTVTFNGVMTMSLPAQIGAWTIL